MFAFVAGGGKSFVIVIKEHTTAVVSHREELVSFEPFPHWFYRE